MIKACGNAPIGVDVVQTDAADFPAQAFDVRFTWPSIFASNNAKPARASGLMISEMGNGDHLRHSSRLRFSWKNFLTFMTFHRERGICGAAVAAKHKRNLRSIFLGATQ